MLFQGNKSLLMYATFRGSKDIVDYLLREEGFNSLTDTDEVTTIVPILSLLSISLSHYLNSLTCTHTHTHTYTRAHVTRHTLTHTWTC
jgi:hypothetical protein